MCGVYGVNIDERKSNEYFEYLIADPYKGEVPEGFTLKTITAFTWVVFPCTGRLTETFQNTFNKIFSEWTLQHSEYEFAGDIA